MQRIVLASALVATAVSAAIPAAERAQLLADFDEWKYEFASDPSAVPHGVSLDNTEEILARLQASKAVIAGLKSTNPEATFGIGKFALYSTDEFKAYVGASFHRGAPKRFLRNQAADLSALPADKSEGEVDWTTSKCVNPIKNQGSCGSCWAFSAVSAVESAHCLATSALNDLSEQQVVSCETEDGQGGCQGGWPVDAITWIAKTNLCLTKDYPYTSGSTGQNGVCKTTCTKQPLTIGETVETSGEPLLKSALDKQPVSIAVEAGNSAWQHYKGGVVTACPGAQSDHAVVAVGYGTDGKDFFKIRNSWGTSWGEKGHIRLQRGLGGIGMCNLAEYTWYPKIKGTPAPTTSAPTTKPAC